MTLTASAISKKRLDRIESDRSEVKKIQVSILNGFHIKEGMNTPRPKSTQHPFALTGVRGSCYTYPVVFR